VIRFTGYGVIAEKPRVGQLGQFFSVHPVGKTMRWIKNNWHLFDGLDKLYYRAKFGEDRTTRAGCRFENVVFVCFFCLTRSEAGALFIRWDIV